MPESLFWIPLLSLGVNHLDWINLIHFLNYNKFIIVKVTIVISLMRPVKMWSLVLWNTMWNCYVNKLVMINYSPNSMYTNIQATQQITLIKLAPFHYKLYYIVIPHYLLSDFFVHPQTHDLYGATEDWTHLVEDKKYNTNNLSIWICTHVCKLNNVEVMHKHTGSRNQRFKTANIKCHYWTTLTHLPLSHPVFLRFILIFSFHHLISSPHGCFPTKTLYAFLVSPPRINMSSSPQPP